MIRDSMFVSATFLEFASLINAYLHHMDNVI
uniref:Uncharacterized protein n=1 Tax=Rhizophora mucronata TaxID=61149 RepID=A0A2P2KAN6_RHIMU